MSLTTDDSRPIIAITMGDASGIGPEVIMKALARDDVTALCRALVIGDALRLRQAGEAVSTGLEVKAIQAAAEAEYIRTSVDHGTAFDIAGKGFADEGSLVEALRQAVDLVPRPSIFKTS